jgi:hypothetical protein
MLEILQAGYLNVSFQACLLMLFSTSGFSGFAAEDQWS